MGFFTETLRLIVDADTAGGVRNVEKFGDASQREFGKAEGALDKWGSRLTTVGAGMIGFGTAALFGLGKAAAASEEAQLSVVKLENTLGNMPKLAGENSKQFLDLAESIQDVTAADADAIVEGQALLGTFNLTAKEIKGITPLVVDYARKFGIDIPDAAVQVGKALDGQVGALKRNGVSIDEVLFKTDRYAAVQQALSDQVGGFAEEEGKTFAGSMERLKNQMGDLVEGVGSGAVDAFTALAERAEGLTDRFKDLDPATQSLIGKIATYGGLALVAAGATGVIAGQAIQLWQNLTTVGEGVSNVTGKLGGMKNILLGAGIAAGIAAISAELATLDDKAFKARFEERFGTIDTLVANLGRTSDAAKAHVEDVIALIDKYGSLNESTRRVADVSVQSAEAFIDAAEAAGIEDEKIAAMRKTLEDHQVAAEESTSGQGDLGGAMDDTASSTDAARESLQEYENQLNAMFDPLFGMLDAQREVSDSAADLAAKQAAVDEAVKQHGAGSIEAAAAVAEFGQAQQDSAESALAHDAAVQQLTTALLTGETTIGEVTAKLQGWVAQGLITQETADAMAAKLAGVTREAIVLGGQNPAVHVSVAGDDEARRRLIELRSAALSVPQRIHIGVTGYGAIPARAGGGPVEEGMPYMVGENRRPELFVPNSDGHIFTEEQLAAAGSGAGRGGWGGGPTQVEHVFRFERTGDRLLDWIIEGLQHEVRVHGGGSAQQFFGRN